MIVSVGIWRGMMWWGKGDKEKCSWGGLTRNYLYLRALPSQARYACAFCSFILQTSSLLSPSLSLSLQPPFPLPSFQRKSQKTSKTSYDVPSSPSALPGSRS